MGGTEAIFALSLISTAYMVKSGEDARAAQKKQAAEATARFKKESAMEAAAGMTPTNVAPSEPNKLDTQRKLALRSGMLSTIKTGGTGLSEAANTSAPAAYTTGNKTYLGQ